MGMSSVLRRCLAMLRAPANEVSFAVRAGIGWSRGAPKPAFEDKREMFASRPAAERRALEARAAELTTRFVLADLHAASTRTTFANNLAWLENLGRLTAGLPVPASPDGVVRAVDVGSGDFHYATALHRWLCLHEAGAPRDVVLRGIEVDGHGIYRDGHSRADHARAHAALAERWRGNVRYEVACAARARLPEQDVVSLLFPFLTAYPVLQWGLPLSRWRPRQLLQRAVRAVRPGGWLLVVNQTAAEWERLQRLLAAEPVDLVRHESFATDLVAHAERTADRTGSLWQRRIAVPDGSGPG